MDTAGPVMADNVSGPPVTAGGTLQFGSIEPTMNMAGVVFANGEMIGGYAGGGQPPTVAMVSNVEGSDIPADMVL